MPEIKQRLKEFFGSNNLLAMWVARARALVLAIPALVYRLRFFVTAFVPLDVKLIGAHRIRLGINTVIGSRSWLNVNDRNGKGPALVIGDHCFIGQENFFTVGGRTVVGDYCLTAKGCAFISSTHIYDNPMMPYIASGTSCNHDIKIGANCFFGFSAMVIGNVTIGHGSVVGAVAVVRESVPPFSLVVGNPAKVVKRFDFGKKEWVKWPTETYVEGPPEDEYLLGLRRNCGAPLQPISAAAGSLYDLR